MAVEGEVSAVQRKTVLSHICQQHRPGMKNKKRAFVLMGLPFPSSSINHFADLILEQGNGEKDKEED